MRSKRNGKAGGEQEQGQRFLSTEQDSRQDTNHGPQRANKRVARKRETKHTFLGFKSHDFLRTFPICRHQKMRIADATQAGKGWFCCCFVSVVTGSSVSWFRLVKCSFFSFLFMNIFCAQLLFIVHHWVND